MGAAAEGGPDVGIPLEQVRQLGIEPHPDPVVAVEQVNELALRPIDAGFEIPDAAHVVGLPVILDPPVSDLVHQRFHVGVRAGVVHHLDLHFSRTHILGQDRLQRFHQKLRTVIYRDHHRPQRPVFIISYRGNGRGRFRNTLHGLSIGYLNGIQNNMICNGRQHIRFVRLGKQSIDTIVVRNRRPNRSARAGSNQAGRSRSGSGKDRDATAATWYFVTER